VTASFRLPAAPRVVPLADVAWQPWRNGRGRTRELLAWPDARDWRVRLSVAEIDEAAPFSAFEGVERWFAVIEGGGVELCVDGHVHRMLPGTAPLRFCGDASVDGSPIAGTTRDLNLMVQGGAGAMAVAQNGAWWSPRSCADRDGPLGEPGRVATSRAAAQGGLYASRPAAQAGPYASRPAAQAGFYAARPVHWTAQLDARRTVVSIEGELAADALLWFERAPQRLHVQLLQPAESPGSSPGWWLAAFPQAAAPEHDRA
jgi:hypothetical protein